MIIDQWDSDCLKTDQETDEIQGRKKPDIRFQYHTKLWKDEMWEESLMLKTGVFISIEESIIYSNEQ